MFRTVSDNVLLAQDATVADVEAHIFLLVLHHDLRAQQSEPTAVPLNS